MTPIPYSIKIFGPYSLSLPSFKACMIVARLFAQDVPQDVVIGSHPPHQTSFLKELLVLQNNVCNANNKYLFLVGG